jgi:hypothetical protein
MNSTSQKTSRGSKNRKALESDIRGVTDLNPQSTRFRLSRRADFLLAVTIAHGQHVSATYDIHVTDSVNSSQSRNPSFFRFVPSPKTTRIGSRAAG